MIILTTAAMFLLLGITVGFVLEKHNLSIYLLGFSGGLFFSNVLINIF